MLRVYIYIVCTLPIACYGTEVTFLMTFLVNKFTISDVDDWNLDDIHANYWNKV